ncbi:MAG: PaaI family thioesterase [candidate division Zixibacteria bacterium]|nr:PaaI family thioesterase [candidate division Zixibacteria bacterium]
MLDNNLEDKLVTNQLSADLREKIVAIINRIPLVKTLKIELDELSPGTCKMSMVRDGTLDGIFVSLHGGALMALADTAACFAIQTLIGVEDTLTTTDMNIRFLAPALDRVTATACVIKAGRTLCPTEISLNDSEGKLLAIAQVTYIRLKKDIGRELEK